MDFLFQSCRSKFGQKFSKFAPHFGAIVRCRRICAKSGFSICFVHKRHSVESATTSSHIKGDLSNLYKPKLGLIVSILSKTLFQVGLTERSPRVRQAVETTLIPTWLGAYKGSILDLLAAIRLDNFQGAKDSAMVAGSLLQSLFRYIVLPLNLLQFREFIN